MKTRCFNKRHRQYKDYGGRGVTVCTRWLSFPNFYADMGPCPPGHTIERKDNEKGYEPGNCVWATRSKQNRNRRQHRWITYDGETLMLAEWVERTGISKANLLHRLDEMGWSVEKALTTPTNSESCSRRWLEHNGQRHLLSHWAKLLGMHEDTLRNRLKVMSVSEALTRPLRQS